MLLGTVGKLFPHITQERTHVLFRTRSNVKSLRAGCRSANGTVHSRSQVANAASRPARLPQADSRGHTLFSAPCVTFDVLGAAESAECVVGR